MSALALPLPSDSADPPWILPFHDTPLREPLRTQQDIVNRARLLHRNSTCPTCGRATVTPIELDDALLNLSGLPIPGTASVVGFSCSACSHNWSTEHPNLRIVG
jgi:hypothetical protein